MPRKLTLVATGDTNSGKTQLLIEYTTINPYREYLPTTFINNVQDVVVDSVKYSVYFVDAESDDDYKILRSDVYNQADCILLCYSMKDRVSYENVKSKWIIEIRKINLYVPIIVVATGTESRVSKSSAAEVSTEDGVNLRYMIGAAAYVECSVQSCIGIDNVFIEAVRSTYTASRRGSRR